MIRSDKPLITYARAASALRTAMENALNLILRAEGNIAVSTMQRALVEYDTTMRRHEHASIPADDPEEDEDEAEDSDEPREGEWGDRMDALRQIGRL